MMALATGSYVFPDLNARRSAAGAGFFFSILPAKTAFVVPAGVLASSSIEPLGR